LVTLSVPPTTRTLLGGVGLTVLPIEMPVKLALPPNAARPSMPPAKLPSPKVKTL
jgi:hypothetical protein